MFYLYSAISYLICDLTLHSNWSICGSNFLNPLQLKQAKFTAMRRI